MLKISIVESRNQRRLVLEGQLIEPWVAELRSACDKARSDLHDRELVLDLRNLTAIGQQAENVLIDLITERIKFRCSGVFTRHVFRQLARRAGRNNKEATR
jgi:hypothetical protein